MSDAPQSSTEEFGSKNDLPLAVRLEQLQKEPSPSPDAVKMLVADMLATQKPYWTTLIYHESDK